MYVCVITFIIFLSYKLLARILPNVQLYVHSAHWVETDYGLSAGQHALLHEGKGKGPLWGKN